MPIGSDTADIHMINIAVTAADGSGQVWQDPTQIIPLGMNGNPEAFVAAIKTGLPLVNNLRILFNEYSFNPDGSMHPLYERFLAAAAAAGYQITLAYGGGDAQNIGIGDADHPFLTNSEAYDALETNISDVSGAWTQMMDWADAHPDTAAAVYGWELMNEAAGYRHSVRANGADASYSAVDFVRLFATHCAELSQLIQSRAEGHILVGGWGYNGDFLTLASATIEGVSVLDYLRQAVGPDLVWSAHLYPGWMGTNLVSDPAALEARLDQIFGPLSGDQVIITETNIDGAVDDQNLPFDFSDLFATSTEWFAENGIGIGWYPGVQTGSSHLIYIESDGSITVRHQHSLAHALDAFSLGPSPAENAGDERIAISLVDARLKNEPYEIAAGEALFDALTKFGTAFGFGGSDTLQGSVLSNDFLYGGSGNDFLKATGGDDFLFGQGDDDRLSGGSGFDHLFGGEGNDTLDAGSGPNLMAGGNGDDVYVVRTARDMVKEFVGGGTDTVNTTLRVLSLGSGNATQYVNIEALAYVGSANFRGQGNALNNAVTGGQGNDTISGMDGNDTLAGRDGDDRLSGGDGADRFVFAQGMGNDEVTDFAGVDRIVFQNLSGISTVQQVMAQATQVGDDVVFDFGPTDSLIVHGVTLAGLTGDILVN